MPVSNPRLAEAQRPCCSLVRPPSRHSKRAQRDAPLVSDEQEAVLSAQFEGDPKNEDVLSPKENKFPSARTRAALASRLGMTPHAVQAWFLLRRRENKIDKLEMLETVIFQLNLVPSWRSSYELIRLADARPPRA